MSSKRKIVADVDGCHEPGTSVAGCLDVGRGVLGHGLGALRDGVL